MIKIGITEFIDPVFNNSWEKWALKDKNPIILITKNIKKLLIDYPGIENLDNILFHSTITGYGNSFLEPNVPHPRELLEFLEKLNHKERFIIRIDPIIPIENFIERSFQVFATATMFGFNRFKVSILDLYPHVLKKFEPYFSLSYELKQIYNWDASHSISGIHKEYMNHAPLDLRLKIINLFENAEVCAEPGIKCSACLSKKDLELFGIKPDIRYPKNEQREFCTCLGIKKNFPRNTKEDCPHHCLYCYMT
jgi:DNA repair photolyase